jgi:hypothetical protein
MDRQIVYPGSIPQDTDILNSNKQPMVAIGRLCAAIFGTGGGVYGLSVSPTSPAGLSVNVGPGEIYQLENVDNTPYGSLSADTANQIVKQGILLQQNAPVILACAAPSTTGFSINYLIEATYADSDINGTVLPYYNANNPSQPFAGPNNDGQSQATTRSGTVSLQAKAGIAAATGSQTTPALDSGYIALAVVTVAHGQTTITTGNIVASANGQILNSLKSGRLLNIQTFSAVGAFTYTPTAGTNSYVAEGVAGAGAGGGSPSCTSSQATGASGGGSGASFRHHVTTGIAPVSGSVGAGGAGGAGVGGNGGATTFGAINAPGGIGGSVGVVTATFPQLVGTSNGAASATGANLINASGASGTSSLALGLSSVLGGNGAASVFGGGANAVVNASVPGVAASTPGSGGSGAVTLASGGASNGGNGAAGIVLVYEYS